MILTVIPNPSLDKTAIVPHFELGKIFRPPTVLGLPGGKAFNFARALHTLGGDPLVVGPLGGYTGQAIIDGAAAEGLRCDPLPVAGETRTCLSIVDPESRQITELYEQGPALGAETWTRLVDHICTHLAATERLVLSGSCFPGTPDDALYELVGMATAAGVPSLLDTYGERLRQALPAGPALVKCNQAEAGDLIGSPLTDVAAAIGAAHEIRRRGAHAVVITLGQQGAIGVDQGGTAFGWAAPRTDGLYSTGSGDSLFAGIVMGLSAQWTLADALRLGVAAGAANTLQVGAGVFERAQALALLEQVIPLPGLDHTGE